MNTLEPPRTDLKRTTTTQPAVDPALLESLRLQKQRRNRMANIVTVVMITLTLLLLGWIAFTMTHPVNLQISRLLGR